MNIDVENIIIIIVVVIIVIIIAVVIIITVMQGSNILCVDLCRWQRVQRFYCSRYLFSS